MSERLNLMIDDGIGAIMTEMSGGERRRGQWLSELVRAMHEQEVKAQQGGDLETLRYAVIGMTGQIKMLDGRLGNVESQLAAIIAKVG
ncbi:MAG: hypothetical protein E6Q97_21050 [Desulfurellales bacterium]|nr:MAG: hypothetical protein E6Q97_21050 [Desulfurellales bacterium]